MKKEIPWKTALRILIIASFVIYILALFYFTIGKSAPVIINGQRQRANLIPFHTIRNYINLVNNGQVIGVAIINLAGNLLLLLPLLYYSHKFLLYHLSMFLIIILIFLNFQSFIYNIII